MNPPADTLPGFDSTALSSAAQGLFSLQGLGHLTASLFLMLLALAVSLPAAHACASVFKNTPPWLRWPPRILAQALAFFPLTALSLSVAGHLAGTQGWPLPGLMPMENEPGLAAWLWYWTLPLCLLCIPVYALAFAHRLAEEPRPRRVMAGAAALAAAGVMMLADTFEILPGMTAPARAARMAHGGLFLQSIGQAVLLALLGMTLTGFWPVPVKKHQPSAADLIREGALVIGLSPWRAWWRHQMPMLIRPAIALLLDLGAWSAALAGAWAVLWPLPLLTGLRAAGARWLEQPAGLPDAALPVVLCSLSLWLAARIVRHGSL